MRNLNCNEVQYISGAVSSMFLDTNGVITVQASIDAYDSINVNGKTIGLGIGWTGIWSDPFYTQSLPAGVTTIKTELTPLTVQYQVFGLF